MSVKILMPALSPTMTEGKIVNWLKKEGEEVRSGDVLAEIETDKATMELESPEDGTLGKIIIQASSDMIKVNELIAVLLEDGEKIEDVDLKAEKAPAKAAKDEPKDDSDEEYDSYDEDEGEEEFEAENGERVFASPLARRLAKEANLDIGSIKGTGSNGRIVKADIEKAISAGSSKNVAVKSKDTYSQLPVADGEAYKDVPLSTMRKVIADRLTESKQNIPHFYLTIDCELEALSKMREELNAKAETMGLNYKLTINDFVIKAVAIAMRRVPGINVSWMGDAMRIYNNVDISVAVSTPGGLITPIIKNADRRRLPDISRSVKTLAAKAREGKLMPEEYQGGSFTISNLGMYGVKDFAAIINPPQSAILAVGASEQRLVVKDGSITIVKMMTCTLSVDHRAVDGAVGAEFLAKFKEVIEEPLMMLL